MVSSPTPTSGPRSAVGGVGAGAPPPRPRRGRPRDRCPSRRSAARANSMSASAASSSQAATRAPRATIWSEASAITTAPRRIERPERDPPPTATRSVSPVTRRTCSRSTPSHSARIWAKLVSWPWPADSVPRTSSIRPSGSHGDLRALARRAGVQLDVVGDADAAVAAAPARLRPARLEPRPVGEGHGAVQRRRVVPAVVDEAERVAIRHGRRRTPGCAGAASTRSKP